MGYDPHKHHRRSIRLKGYDYTRAGAYFVTLVTRGRECWFGHIVDGEMVLNEMGKICADAWLWLAIQYDYVDLDEWVVMPNHLHGIIVITDDVGTTGMGGSRGRGGSYHGVDSHRAVDSHGRGGSRTAPTAKRKPLGRLIGAFKTVSTKRINEMRQTPGETVWQRNYYERIIRNETELNRIREYIINNPAKWEMDRENPGDRYRRFGDRPN